MSLVSLSPTLASASLLRPLGYITYAATQREQTTSKDTTSSSHDSSYFSQWQQLTPTQRKEYELIETSILSQLPLKSITHSNNQVTNSSQSQPPSQSSVTPSSTSSSSSTAPPSSPSWPPPSSSPLSLPHIRYTLIRLEESIIFALIERSQWKHNNIVYTPGAMPQFKGKSFLFHFLTETEKLHATVRRYTSPDEHPFSSRDELPEPILPAMEFSATIKPCPWLNINNVIYSLYCDSIVPMICQAGDDENYGSSATCDMHVLQLLSKRIHYGKFVAESKFRAETTAFTTAIRARDTQALSQLITKPIVEEEVIKRVHLKAATYGHDPTLDDPSTTSASLHISPRNNDITPTLETHQYKIQPQVIAHIYLQIMEFTKQVQIEYLLRRLDD